MATAAGTTSSAGSSSAEAEALKLALEYLVNSVDTPSLLPAALSRGLIREQQKADCASESNPYKKAEKFLEYLQREVNGDNKKFHTFVQLLVDTGQSNLASHLNDELSNATRLMQAVPTVTATTNTEGEPQKEHIIVPDSLLKELISLRISYARFLRRYKREIQNSPEAQEELVETLPRLLHGEIGSDRNFQSYFDTLVEEEVSLFNVTYLKQICEIFPEDVCATTEQLVVKYEEQQQHFMDGTTLSQFKKLIPASALLSKLSTGKIVVTLKLKSFWGKHTLNDLKDLVCLFGIPGSHLHLEKVSDGSVIVRWLCSTTDAKELKIAIVEVTDSLQTNGVLQVFIGEELVLECSQSDQELPPHEARTFEFVDEPDSDYFCPVCQDLLTDPFQLECGHQLCHECCDRLLTSNKADCPTCRDSAALKNARIDKFLKRKVNSVRVYCQHHKEGCKWVGEVRYLQNHLERSVVVCPFRCGKYSCEVVMKEHKSLHCPNRLVQCKNCDYYNKFMIVTNKHYPICPQSPVDCPNHCPVEGLIRYQLKQHFNECSHQVVKCPQTGCSIWLLRAELKIHKLHVQQHNLVLMNTNQAADSPPLQYLHNQAPIEFVIQNFQDMKNANAEWKSPILFTHKNGNKFCLEVNPNGCGIAQGSHVSVHVCLTKGEYDNGLVWPFEGDVVIELLNWSADKNHISNTVHLNRYTGRCNSYVTKEECESNRLGTSCFVPHSSLLYDPDTNTEYLQDDCLRLRVVDVAVYFTPLLSKNPSWQDPHTATQSVCEFTLTEFTKRKQFNNVYYSPPFYSHPHGYKLCIKVIANGHDVGKHTHITIGANLMRGDYDNNLQWPFEGDVVIELLNWREDNDHYRGNTMSFNGYHGSIAIQVIEDEFAPKFWELNFISHYSLLYNPDTNKEYLQDDCLRLRVVDVAIYSTPILSKTPSWQDSHTATQSVCEFTLTEFTKRKQFNNVYYSPPFYSHTQGYKLCIKVLANGHSTGKYTHISIGANLMKGDYDNNLQWPFEGDVVIELLNWREDNDHYRGNTISVNRNYDLDGSITGRVTEREYAPKAWGRPCFISYSSLLYNPDTNTEYLQDDCLRLRVVDVAIYSTPLLSKTPSWQDPHTVTQSVCNFTLTEFTKRKQFNNVYFSPPFYSHPHGYKLCIAVYANGCGFVKGSHVSIYASLMRGDYDNNLQWPFEGDIVVELLNWKENSHHYRENAIHLNKHNEPDGSISSHVTDGEHAPYACRFISHSGLLYNPDTNTEYLQNDCLQLRVVDVAVYSTPLLSKTPSWQDPHTATQSVCDFTLTEFTKRKQYNNAYYSPPFYSHPHGYKLCIRVDAIGDGVGKDTHVSIFFNLMRGDYDNNLLWPFEGDIVVELLNWRNNSHHCREDIIHINRHSDTDGSTTSRVTEKKYAPSGPGRHCFISHSSLLYNPDTNTEYLQDDCLRLRVVDVAIYSTPLLSKIPSWQDPHTATQSVCEFTLTEFTKRKQLNNLYYSPPFNSHPHGYKLCIKVYANGDGEGKDTHISIYANLMRGNYDNNLQWPFEGDVIVEILNWKEDNHHYRGDTIALNRHRDTDGSITSRVTDREYAPSGHGRHYFIPHSSLLYDPDTNTEYLQDDCLRLRVVDIAIYSTPLLSRTPSWQDPHTATQSVCDFTLTEFTKRKQFNNVYYSPPFYSHPHGYKLCIKVYANGLGEGKDTHISIYVYHMRGEYDNNLQWPFEGDIVFELLNWGEDNYHYRGGTLSINSHGDTDGSGTNRVTEGEYAPRAWGIHRFISHSSLLFNPDTSTKYLRDDCLYLRVVNVAVYSTSLLSKTPSWQDPHTATQSVCDFTLTEFAKRKQFNNGYYSPPFYSHPHGYKLCLKVGFGGSLIVIIANLMRGDYDNKLQWPFEGDIVVELLNWREDNHHYRGEKHFLNKYPDGRATSRVTYGECAPNGLRMMVISPSYLFYDPDINAEYLQDDCLRLRVVDVAVYSTPLLSKTPFWQDPHTATLSVCDFTLTEFTKRKQLNNEYYSPPFYSHPHGYKLCIKVYANGDGKGKDTHISIGANLMRGDYDNNLRWPFEGDIVVELLNWREDDHHYRGDIIYLNKQNDTDGSYTSRVTEGEYAPNELCRHTFISHSFFLFNPDTNIEYLQDDCLRLRVVDVAVYSTPLLSKTPLWQGSHTATQSECDFTLTEFTKRKQFDNVYCSPPFYSHSHGYKLCIKVYANGHGEGKDTHISIYAYLMKGDYDNDLQWPFEGDIVVELLNWREDNHHYRGDTIFSTSYNDTDGGITSCVSEGKYAPKKCGKVCFISHSSLLYNPEKNIEYLQDDCLRLRVVDVVVYSTPLLSKIPSWQDPHTATQSVCDFTLTEFTKRKQFNNAYYSPPFYSHPHGYKLCLKVCGVGKGTCILVAASLMRGDYDNNLHWPFEADIVVELLNWREDNRHHRGDTFSRHNVSSTSRLTDGLHASNAFRIVLISPSSFLYNPDTNTEYLQDDCLRLRVVDVAVYSTPLLSKTPSWQNPHTATQSVCGFTLTEFTKRKQFNNAYYSPPFYSHPHGYKLCIKVYANGDGKGKHTHISISASLMRGDYDNNLQWPFEGDIVVELLNWRKDNHHYRGDIITLNKHNDIDGSITSRVTEGEYAPKMRGISRFISHSSLLYNPCTKTEYLQDDCVRLRVVDVTVHSAPHL